MYYRHIAYSKFTILFLREIKTFSTRFLPSNELSLQDPSVQNAVSNPGNKVDLDDYNPFDGKTQIQSPAVMNPTEDLPPAEIPAPQIVQQPKVSTADFQVGFH